MSEPMPREEIVSRYLDGLLEGDELRAFEEMRTSDPLIRAVRRESVWTDLIAENAKTLTSCIECRRSL